MPSVDQPILATPPPFDGSHGLPHGGMTPSNSTTFPYLVSYPYLLLSLAPLIFGLILTIIGSYLIIAPYSKERYYGD